MKRNLRLEKVVASKQLRLAVETEEERLTTRYVGIAVIHLSVFRQYCYLKATIISGYKF